MIFLDYFNLIDNSQQNHTQVLSIRGLKIHNFFDRFINSPSNKKNSTQHVCSINLEYEKGDLTIPSDRKSIDRNSNK